MGLTSRPFTVALDMPFWKQSARFALGAGTALLLAVPAPVAAEPFPEPVDDLAVGATPHPAATLPVPPAPLTDFVSPRLTPGSGALPAVVPIFGRSPLTFSPAIAPGDPVLPGAGGFSVRLMARMNHEARRFRRDNVSES